MPKAILKKNIMAIIIASSLIHLFKHDRQATFSPLKRC